MEAESPTPKRRVVTRYSEADRERLIGEQASSGVTKTAFCAQRGINLSTFHGWAKRRKGRKEREPVFAQGQLVLSAEAADVEVLLPNGVRVSIRHAGQCEELVSLIRGVAGASEAQGC